MAKLDARVSRQVTFDLVPVVTVVADLFAVRADGQKRLELVDLCQSSLEFVDALCKVVLKRNHSLSDPHAGQQFAAVKGFHKIIVCAALESRDDVLGPILSRQEDDISRLRKVQ